MRGACLCVDFVAPTSDGGHERALQWWTRFSSRQQQEKTLGGVTGDWTLEGELTELLPWFWLGQWLHVGKNATMGMGMHWLAW